jgi:hypothetical protein
MIRTAGGVLTLLLLALPAAAEDKPKDQPTPKEQYQALLKEQADAMKAFQEAYNKAETAEDKNKVFQEKYPQPDKVAPKFLELAEKNPKDPVAIDALVWVVNNAGRAGKDSARTKAIAQLTRDHVQSEKMASVCQGMGYGNDKESLDLLRAVLAKNTHKEAQVEACLALAQRLSTTAQIAQHLKEHPDDAKRYEQFYGKDYVAELQKTDADKVEAEIAGLYKDVGDKYAPEMKAERLTQLCQRVGQTGGAGAEALLRSLMEKDKRQDVQGVACLSLAQALKSRADGMPEAKAKEAEKVRKESEGLFERAADKYADAVLYRRMVKGEMKAVTVGERAKGELFEVKFLAVGKPVPDVEGEDADGKAFKLSDYRGKVVLLDFWGNW